MVCSFKFNDFLSKNRLGVAYVVYALVVDTAAYCEDTENKVDKVIKTAECEAIITVTINKLAVVLRVINLGMEIRNVSLCVNRTHSCDNALTGA